MLDADLADVYGVTTKALNQAVKRETRIGVRSVGPETFLTNVSRDILDKVARGGSCGKAGNAVEWEAAFSAALIEKQTSFGPQDWQAVWSLTRSREVLSG